MIQEAIMPTTTQGRELLGEHFVILLPKDIVSGDFYWLHHDQQRTFLVVADCTGHGVAGAFMSLLGYSLLNHIIKEKKIVRPHEILETLHSEIQVLLRQNETGNVDGMDASVFVYEKVEQTHWHIEFCGAKRPLYYFEANSTDLQELQGDKKSIGGKQPPHRQFQTQYLKLPLQSMCYLFSDGYADQNDAQRVRFGVTQFKQALTQLHNKPLQEQKEILLEKLHNHTQDTTQRDDILVVGLKVV
jgi:serine phosphatase RsbU (regulator of sigma subunit)